MKSVITGDIIDSTSISKKKDRELLTKSLKAAVKDACIDINDEISIEVYRGDSFQIVCNKPEDALRMAILLRTGLQKNTPTGLSKWDARLAIGIGEIDYTSRNSRTSDGEAFRYSGRELDKLDKENHLSIKTPWEDFNAEFAISTPFADNLVSNWTVAQSVIIYTYLLKQDTQKNIALLLNKSTQLVSYHLTNAHISLIDNYLNRYQHLVNTYIQHRNGIQPTD